MGIAVLGGVFDPPHIGHVALARAGLAHFQLEDLLVLVVADPGHKSTETPAETRLELTGLAFEDVIGARVELDPHARTVDSLEERRLREAVFLVGADELADFPLWKDPERVLELVRLGVATRPGVSQERLQSVRASLPAPGRISFFEMEPVSVSSSEVRRRVARGEPIGDHVPPQVAAAIARLGLYKDERRVH